jgi:dTDP-glucose 4,6-dehydratase
MRLLATGAAGFIGTTFARQALGARRATVERLVVVDALTYAGNYANLTDLAADPCFRFVKADIADDAAMAALVRERIDTLVNFAAESHVDRSIEDTTPFLRRTSTDARAAQRCAASPASGRSSTSRLTRCNGTIPTGRATETA